MLHGCNGSASLPAHEANLSLMGADRSSSTWACELGLLRPQAGLPGPRVRSKPRRATVSG